VQTTQATLGVARAASISYLVLSDGVGRLPGDDPV